jgi:hypothetical protein
MPTGLTEDEALQLMLQNSTPHPLPHPPPSFNPWDAPHSYVPPAANGPWEIQDFFVLDDGEE